MISPLSVLTVKIGSFWLQVTQNLTKPPMSKAVEAAMGLEDALYLTQPTAHGIIDAFFLVHGAPTLPAAMPNTYNKKFEYQDEHRSKHYPRIQ